jgi:hypothetical protein
MPESPHGTAQDGTTRDGTAPDDHGRTSGSALRRLASRLRRPHRSGPPADAGPAPSADADPARPAAGPPSGLRPQPEDDASIYPLF